jgi:hypothetical protein
MIARFDHRPMLTATLALATTVLVVVVITLSMLLITAPPAVSPPSISDGGNPAAHAQSGGGVGSGADADLSEQHAQVVAHHAQVVAAAQDQAERHTQMVAAQR